MNRELLMCAIYKGCPKTEVLAVIYPSKVGIKQVGSVIKGQKGVF